MTLRVLQVGDVAGVGRALSMAVAERADIRIDDIEPPTTAARASPLLKALAWPVRAARLWWLVRYASRHFQPDVVHLHWARYAPFLPRRVPVVVHAHGSDLRGRRHGRWSLVDRALRRAAVVLVSTPDLLDDAPPGARYLPNAVDIETFRPPREPPAPGERVLVFARLSEVKGAATIAAAVATLLARRPSVAVTAFAGGALSGDVAAAGARLRPESADRAAMAELVGGHDVVIGQQRIGALGLSELEAMACGRPVVVALRPEWYPPDLPVVGVPPGDAEAVADAVDTMIADVTARQQLGQAARSFVEQHHDIDVIAAQLIEIYRQVAARA
ncbi:MAG: glycosyltransferase family 4 protein [Desertimonas sp.]